jgi:hypothetical protein
VSPRALSEDYGMLKLRQVSSLEGARECTRWVYPSSPRAILEGSVGGLFSREPLILRLNIPIC